MIIAINNIEYARCPKCGGQWDIDLDQEVKCLQGAHTIAHLERWMAQGDRAPAPSPKRHGGGKNRTSGNAVNWAWNNRGWRV